MAGRARFVVGFLCCAMFSCTRVFGSDAAVAPQDDSAESGASATGIAATADVNGGDSDASPAKRGAAAVGPADVAAGVNGGDAVKAPCVSAAEQCDAVDNDCDGQSDENLTQACGAQMVGDCRPGVQVCSGGQWTACVGAIAPRAEDCDDQGHDENCDGLVNEGCPCQAAREQACGAGMCKGAQRCENGTWSAICSGEGMMGVEICDANNQDEDCDGMANEDCACAEGAMEVCPGNDRGPCRPGIRTCDGGQWGACTGIVGGTSETCDGLDNDCDGITDNGMLCGEGARCEGGRCVRCLTDGECQGTSPPACQESYCDVAAALCMTRYLADRTRCSGGVCRAGSCFAGCIEDGDCTSPDEICSGNRCMLEAGCGNDRLDPGEQCESTLVNETCRSLGYDGGNLTCRNCTYDTRQCFNDDPPSGGTGG